MSSSDCAVLSVCCEGVFVGHGVVHLALVVGVWAEVRGRLRFLLVGIMWVTGRLRLSGRLERGVLLNLDKVAILIVNCDYGKEWVGRLRTGVGRGHGECVGRVVVC